MESNLSLIKPFIILTLRVQLLWNACNNPNPRNLGVKRGDVKLYLSPPVTQKSACSDSFRQWSPIWASSHHSLYSHWDIGRVQLLWNACNNPNSRNLGVKSGDMSSPKCAHPWLKNQPAVTVLDNEVQSQSHLTIHYTHNETLEGSSCCEMLVTIQSHAILVWKVGMSSWNCPQP